MDWLLNQRNEAKFVLVDSSGVEVTGLGSGFTLEVSKPGDNGFASSSGDKSELGDGWYRYYAALDEADTEGEIAIRVTGAGISQQNLVYTIREATADEVWNNSRRTLTQVVDEVSLISSGNITIQRGDDWSYTIAGVDLSGWTVIDFSAKTNKSDTDAQRRVHIRRTSLANSLLLLNGAAPVTGATGSIDVNGDSLTFNLNAKATSLLALNTIYWDAQKIAGSLVETLRKGKLTIEFDVTQAII